MDTNKYAALLSIIRLGSLSAAAEKMGYSPSGMTRMMDSLENEMGFPLLHRTSQGVQLTEEGKRLLPSIRELLLAEKKTRAVRCDILSLTAGELFIGSYSSTAAVWLPPVLHRYCDLYPDVAVHLREGSNRELLEALQDGELSCAILSEPRSYKGDWIPLMEDRLLVWLPSDSKLAEKEAVHPKDLDGLDFVSPPLHAETDVEAIFEKHDIHPTFRLTTSSNYTAWRMVAAGLGVSINNELVSENWKEDVVTRPFVPEEKITLGIALPSLRDASPALKKFIAEMKAHLAGEKE